MPVAVGLRVGRLVVLKRAGSNKQRQSLWLCRCDCGAEKTVAANNLLHGRRTRSCGCYRRDYLEMASEFYSRDFMEPQTVEVAENKPRRDSYAEMIFGTRGNNNS